MKKQEVKIELTKQSFTDLMNIGGYCLVDLAHLPFDEFTIVHPSSAEEGITYDEVEEMFEKFGSYLPEYDGISDSEKEKVVKKLMSDMTSSKIEIDVAIADKTMTIAEGDTWKLIVTTKDFIYDSRHIEAHSDLLENIEFVSNNERIKNLFGVDKGLTRAILSNINLVLGLISFLQSDKETVVKPITKIDIKSKKNKKGKTISKTYIYKKRYVLGDDLIINPSDSYLRYEDHSRAYERKTESWFSRGHWRTLKDGTKTWVKASVKRAKNAVSNITKEYKITKIK